MNKTYYIILFSLLLGSCSTLFKRPTTTNISKLRFIGDFNIHSEIDFKKTPLGGFSGLFFDTNKNRLIAVSDDRGMSTPSRFYTFQIDLRENSLNLYPENVFILKNMQGLNFPPNTLDPEDIIILPNKNYVIASERGFDKVNLSPEIIEFKNNGKFVEFWDFHHKRFTKNDDLKKGIYQNKGFESLSITPNGQKVFTATEDSLRQDGPLSTLKKGSLLRIVEFKKYKNIYKVNKEYAYPLDPIPNKENIKKVKYAENGLSAFLALNEFTLITVERSFMTNTGKNSIKIFVTKIEEKSTDVLKQTKLNRKKINLLPKSLLIDLDNITPLLSKGLNKLDNIEGICLGPRLENGNQTLILVSDNNFSKKQRTLFLAFEITQNLD